MLAVAIIIGGLSIYEVDKYVQEQTEDFVNITGSNEGAKINDSLSNMEKSVKIMESYLLDFFKSEEDVEDRALQEQVIESADKMFIDVVKHTSTKGAIAYYFRLDPAISDSTAGLFYSKTIGTDEFTSFAPTDIAIYERDDTEHVGWFWEPYDAGEPIWMKPYYNQNNEFLMISYVIPMYYGDKFIGVVGMDFDYTVLAERVHEIKVYERGFAHLEMNGEVIHSGDQDGDGKDEDEGKYLRVSKELVNGMNLVLSASYEDIRQIRYEIALKIIFSVIVLTTLFTIIAVVIVKRIVGPLKKLTDASVKLSNGDYNVEIPHSNTQEIELLSTAFENMTTRLREREEHLHLSANRDSLTGLRNTTSYKAWAAKFNEKIEAEQADFGIIVLDINDLKKTNDENGHEVGNELIVAAAKLISGIFKRSPVFRIGGDEFLVVIQDDDLKNREKLLDQLNSECAETFVNSELKIPLAIAVGCAMFDPEKDAQFADVFNRADNAMYENKRMIKANID